MPLYDFECPTCGTIEVFRHMTQELPTQCETCGANLTRVFNVPRVAVKASPESPTDSVKRVLGEKRKHFDCPWPDAKGKHKRVYLKGSKAEQKAQIQDAILSTPIAKKRKLERKDINPVNL